MSWAMAVGAAVTATGAIIQNQQAKSAESKARRKAREAQRELDAQKDRFRNLDTSNPYLNMENVFEDLTVNTQAAEFQRDQQMATQANIMGQMRGAAGSSGIAALAQTLANQGALDAQKSQALIAEQEQANKLQERQEAARIMGLEREGELISRQAQHGKISALMGMAADEVSVHRGAEAAAIQAQQAAQQQMVSAAGQVAMSGMAAKGAHDVKFNQEHAAEIAAGTMKEKKGHFGIDANQFASYNSGLGGVGGGTESDMFAMFQKWLASQQ